MLKVLIVEDEQIPREQVAKIFKNELGYEVDAVISGEEALKILRSKPIDAVLLDIGLPDMDGFDIVNTAKEEKIKTDFIVITGFGDDNAAETRCQDLNIPCMIKPVSIIDVNNKLCEMFPDKTKKIEIKF